MSNEEQELKYVTIFHNHESFLSKLFDLKCPYESGKSISKEELIHGIINYQNRFNATYFRIRAKNYPKRLDGWKKREKYVNKLIRKRKYSKLELRYVIHVPWPFDMAGSQKIRSLESLFNNILKEVDGKYELDIMGDLMSKNYELTDKENKAIIKCFD